MNTPSAGAFGGADLTQGLITFSSPAMAEKVQDSNSMMLRAAKLYGFIVSNLLNVKLGKFKPGGLNALGCVACSGSLRMAKMPGPVSATEGQAGGARLRKFNSSAGRVTRECGPERLF
jgi:hypothetical protein